ncbi:MAG: sirohydrochlorin chelatase [Thermogutta sp.]
MVHSKLLRRGVMAAAAVIALGLTQATLGIAEEKLGLLIIGHGSPINEWNQAFLEFGKRVAEPAVNDRGFAAVRTVFMEFASPTISDGLRELEAEGCNAVVAVPAFVMVGHHTLFDVPAALGIYYSRHSVEHLAEHGSTLSVPKIPVLYTAALDEGDLLERYVISEIQRMSENPEREAVVLLVHGDAEQRPLVESRLRTVINAACAKTGISYADYAFIGVGQGFEHHGVPVLLQTAEKRSRVLVIGLYMAMSADAIFRRAAARSPQIAEQFQGRQIVFSKGNVIDFPETAGHLLGIATEAAGARRGHDR